MSDVTASAKSIGDGLFLTCSLSIGFHFLFQLNDRTTSAAFFVREKPLLTTRLDVLFKEKRIAHGKGRRKALPGIN